MKFTYLISLLFLFACFGKKPLKTGFEGNPIPSWDVLALDSITHFNIGKNPAKHATILFSFEPWCPYCKAQTEELISVQKELKDVDIYMVAAISPLTKIKEFNSHYNLSEYPNIKVGLDSTKSIRKYFKDYRVPYIAVYGPDDKLRQVFLGKSNTNAIVDIATEGN